MFMTEMAAFVWLAGFVIGLQRSGYWTEATIRTHKVTKPLIWLGLFIATLGGAWYYSLIGTSSLTIAHIGVIPIMILNGSFLSFWISPRLLERERKGKASEILPKPWKTAVTLSFFVSIITWWGSLALAVIALVD
jgi:hypothetical protein